MNSYSESSTQDNATDLLKFESDHSIDLPKVETPRSTVTDEFWSSCETFVNSMAREMASVTEFAKTKPGDVPALLECKQVLIELASLHLAVEQAAEKLRAITNAQ